MLRLISRIIIIFASNIITERNPFIEIDKLSKWATLWMCLADNTMPLMDFLPKIFQGKRTAISVCFRLQCSSRFQNFLCFFGFLLCSAGSACSFVWIKAQMINPVLFFWANFCFIFANRNISFSATFDCWRLVLSNVAISNDGRHKKTDCVSDQSKFDEQRQSLELSSSRMISENRIFSY